MHFVFTRAKLEAKERAEKKRVLEEEEERWIIKINKNLWWHCTSVIRNLIQDGIWWNLSIHNRTKAKIHYNFWKAFKLDIVKNWYISNLWNQENLQNPWDPPPMTPPPQKKNTYLNIILKGLPRVCRCRCISFIDLLFHTKMVTGFMTTVIILKKILGQQ